MINQSRGILRIGTSGIVVPGSKQSFPMEFRPKSRLNYYASLFNTVEVNSTFRKIPLPSTVERWSLDVPEEFEFTLKLWREVTHVKQLNVDVKNIGAFLNTANYIGKKKGCLLVQFPGSITNEYSLQVEHILLGLKESDQENQWRKAIEFRSVTWYHSDIYKLLDRYDASIVLQDMPKSKNLVPNEESKFMYFRFHGPKGDYRCSYDQGFLKERAEQVNSLLDDGKDVYAYFNNTMGNAFENAMSLKSMVKK